MALGLEECKTFSSVDDNEQSEFQSFVILREWGRPSTFISHQQNTCAHGRSDGEFEEFVVGGGKVEGRTEAMIEEGGIVKENEGKMRVVTRVTKYFEATFFIFIEN